MKIIIPHFKMVKEIAKNVVFFCLRFRFKKKSLFLAIHSNCITICEKNPLKKIQCDYYYYKEKTTSSMLKKKCFMSKITENLMVKKKNLQKIEKHFHYY